MPSIKTILKTLAYAFGLFTVACGLSSCTSIVDLLSYLITLPIDVLETVLPVL